MRTLVFKLKNNDNNVSQIKDFQKDWSICFRQLYNNLDLSADKNYLNSLRIKSSKLKEYLKKEVIAFHERKESSKELIQEKIDELYKKVEKDKLDIKEFKQLKKLEKSLKSNVVFGGRKNLIKRSQDKISNKEWKDNRLYPLIFYGDKSSKGNRFFDFKDLSNGKIMFKMETTKVKLPLKISTKKHNRVLQILQEMALNKEIPITVKLSHDKIQISYEEGILSDSKLDSKKLHKECPFNKKTQPLQRKSWYKKQYRKHEQHLKHGKLERYLAVDLNPNKIGYVITDNQLNIIDKGCFEIELPKSNKYSNKRKYNYGLIIKELFKLVEHYKVSYFVIEDLEDTNEDDHGNKTANRKIKQEWMLNMLKQLIERRCNESKTILKVVPAYYSSFIGNLMYDIYDPIASSYELCRRGIGQFNKGFKMIPEYDVNNIITDRIDDSIDIQSCKSFVELFKSMRNKSYRRNDKTFYKYLLTEKTNIYIYN